MLPAAIKNKIERAQEYLSAVLPYTSVPETDLLANKEKLAAMERWYLLMVDEAVDINAALTYQLSNKVVESYKSSFSELPALGIIDTNFAE